MVIQCLIKLEEKINEIKAYLIKSNKNNSNH